MKDKNKILAARVPVALIRRIDKAAKGADRTRSAEVRRRLEESLAQDTPSQPKAARQARVA